MTTNALKEAAAQSPEWQRGETSKTANSSCRQKPASRGRGAEREPGMAKSAAIVVFQPVNELPNSYINDKFETPNPVRL